jgi:hypothetical protein
MFHLDGLLTHWCILGHCAEAVRSSFPTPHPTRSLLSVAFLFTRPLRSDLVAACFSCLEGLVPEDSRLFLRSICVVGELVLILVSDPEGHDEVEFRLLSEDRRMTIPAPKLINTSSFALLLFDYFCTLDREVRRECCYPPTRLIIV